MLSAVNASRQLVHSPYLARLGGVLPSMGRNSALVVAVSSSALFDLAEADAIFNEQGARAFTEHQVTHEQDALAPGVAFAFVRELLRLNDVFDDDPIEVILMSRNDMNAGMRVMLSIEHHELRITRAMFLSGNPPWPYASAFRAQLYLSSNREDVRMAVENGIPAGQVLPGPVEVLAEQGELRIAFDFDGVIADDASEQVHLRYGLARFHDHERDHAHEVLGPGPLALFLEEVARLQEREREKKEQDEAYTSRIRTALFTARDGPGIRRVVNTFRERKVTIDETFFLGGLSKTEFLRVFRPHIYFDDHPETIQHAASVTAAVHIPYGVRNPRSTREEPASDESDGAEAEGP